MMEEESCKNATSAVTRVAKCDLCRGQMKFTVPPNSVIRAMKCDLCGETAAVGPPPPHNMFTGCPHCQFLLVHSLDATTVVCPRVKCGKRVNVSQGLTKSVTCDICKSLLTYRGQAWWVVCSSCCEATIVGPVPKGKQAVRCLCQALLILNCNAAVGHCPRKNCGRLLQLSPSQGSGMASTDNTASSCIHLHRDKYIAQGTFGTLYRATYVRLQCAAKLFNIPPPLGDRQSKRVSTPSLIPSVRPLCALSHPNLVKYIGVFSDLNTDLPLIAMELVKGNLTHYLEHLPAPIPLHVQLDFSCDIAGALSYLHEKAIIHGNLCSSNLLLTEKGKIKVSDYEVLSVYSHVTVQQLGPNILPYMPPEAFSQPPTRTERLDSFSWSVLALQIITRLFPNPGPTVQTVTDPRLLAIKPLQQPLSEISRRKNHIDLVNDSNPLLSVLVLCLDDSGEKRPSMTEVCEMLSLMKLSEDYKLSQRKMGINWSERQLYVLDYELVRIQDQSEQHSASTYRAHSQQVEEAGSDFSKLSIQNSNRAEGQAAAVARMEQENNVMKSRVDKEDDIGQSVVNVAVCRKEVRGEVVVPISKEVCSVSPEPSALQQPSHRDHAATTQPVLPPYSAIAPSQNTPPPTDQCVTRVASPYEVAVSSPPPYTLLPPEYPQLPCVMASPHDPTDDGNMQAGNGLLDFQCAVCKYKSKYKRSPGQRIGLVRCPRCKECTAVMPPAEGKVYGRCAFCNCLVVYSATSKRLICPRETCKEVLFVTTSRQKMMRRLPCQVCKYVMHVVQDPHDVVTSAAHVCSQCGEANPLGPAPPGKEYTRCPYCNVLIKHNSSSSRKLCPRSTCRKVVELGNGEKLSVECETCKKLIFYYGDKNIVICGHCGKGKSNKIGLESAAQLPVEQANTGVGAQAYLGQPLASQMTMQQPTCNTGNTGGQPQVSQPMQQPNAGRQPQCLQVVGKPPAGKGYLICECNSLLIYDKGKNAVKCPVKNCGKLTVISAVTTPTSSHQKAVKE